MDEFPECSQNVKGRDLQYSMEQTLVNRIHRYHVDKALFFVVDIHSVPFFLHFRVDRVRPRW